MFSILSDNKHHTSKCQKNHETVLLNCVVVKIIVTKIRRNHEMHLFFLFLLCILSCNFFYHRPYRNLCKSAVGLKRLFVPNTICVKVLALVISFVATNESFRNWLCMQARDYATKFARKTREGKQRS